MQDYNYIYQGTYELTLELSCCKYPPESELEGLWNQNKEALIAYLQAAHMGKLYYAILTNIDTIINSVPLVYHTKELIHRHDTSSLAL